MNRKWNFGLSLAAGLLGGILSHYIAAKPVHAQPEVTSSKVIQAQKFVVVNDKGVELGVFGIDTKGDVHIAFRDSSGKLIWSR